jgi:hypothetical protein
MRMEVGSICLSMWPSGGFCEHIAEPCIFHEGRTIVPLLVPNAIKRIYL